MSPYRVPSGLRPAEEENSRRTRFKRFLGLFLYSDAPWWQAFGAALYKTFYRE